MSDLDDRLSDYAEAWRGAQPPTQVDWPTVTRRRRPNRWVPVAVAVGVAALLTVVSLLVTDATHHTAPVAAPTPTPTASPLAFDVPWVNRPAPPYSPPSPLPTTPPPTDAATCAAAQLTVDPNAVRGSGVSEDDGVIIPFRNSSTVTCLLSGFPKAVLTGAGLSPYPLPLADAAPFTDNSSWNMAPGQTTLVWIRNPRECTANGNGAGTTAPRYTTATFQIPGGGTTIVNGLQLHAACGIAITDYFRDPPPPTYPPAELSTVTAALTVPASVTAGDTLTYEVTLTDPTDTASAIDPCPGYLEYANPAGINIKQEYALNCDTVHAIPAHGAVRYQMKLAVPANVPAGDMTVRWTLILGPDSALAQATVHVNAAQSPPIASGTPTCTASQLTARGGRQGGGFGTAHGDVEFTNTGSAPCQLQGTPGLALAKADGTPLDVTVTPAQGNPSPALATPGEQWSVSLALSWVNWCGPKPGPLTLRITLTPGGDTVTVPFDGPPDYDYLPLCLNPKQPSTINVINPYYQSQN